MKIAYLLGSLNRGGAETLLLDVLSCAYSLQLDAIAIYREGGTLEHSFMQNNTSLYKNSNKKNIFSYLWTLRRTLIQNNVQIVHAQQPIDALFGWIACKGIKIKIVLTWHGYDFQAGRLSTFINRFIVKRVCCNIFVSQEQQAYYLQQYKFNPERSHVIYNGIDFSKFNIFNSLNTNLRKELDIPQEAILLGSVGNFNNVRDQITLCRFLKLLQEQNVLFHFLFVGKRVDNLPQKYDDCVEFCQQNNLSNRVHFLGTRQDVPQILTQLDAFLYATDHDTFGISVVEAIAAGTPVFVNDWGVMKEITEDGEYATLYKTKDEKDLLYHFMLFLKNQTYYKEKALEFSKCVREKYSIEKHIQELVNVYRIL